MYLFSEGLQGVVEKGDLRGKDDVWFFWKKGLALLVGSERSCGEHFEIAHIIV
jgi:hypothetical protein